MPSRYDRQVLLFGEEGQKKLAEAKVGIAGCGGLGTVVVTNLASAGVGSMIIADKDVPDITNLNRQFVYREGDEESKADLLSQWACDLNPEVAVDYYEGELNEFTLPALFEDCDILVDCLDNMETRMLLNDFAMESGKILVHAGVTGYAGQVTVIVPGKTPGLEEIYRYVKPSAGTPPSVGSMVSLIGSLEATQVIQMITGTGSPFVGKLATVDLQNGSIDIINLSS